MNQIRIIKGPPSQCGLIDVEPYCDPVAKRRRVRPDEALMLIRGGWAEPVVEEAKPERAVKAPKRRRAVKPAAKKAAKKK